MSDATSHGGDATHSGSRPGTLTPPLERRWKQTLPGDTAWPPLVGGGRVFSVSAWGGPTRLHAFDVSSGRASWPAVDLGVSGVMSLAFDSGRVFVATLTGLSAIDAATGKVVWQKKADPFHAAITAVDGTVYVDSSGLHAYSALDGRHLWTATYFGDGGGGFATPTVAEGRVFIASGGGNVRAFNAATGAPLWSLVGPWSGGGSGVTAYHRGRLYVVGSENDPGMILDAASGRQLGTFSSGRGPALEGSRGYFVDPADMTVRAEDLDTHVVHWSTPLPDNGTSPAAIVQNGYVYIGSDRGVLSALDAETGTVVWSDQAGPSPQDRWHGIHDINAGNGVLVVVAGADIVVYGQQRGSPGVSRPAPDDPVQLDVGIGVPAPISPAVGYQTNLAHTGEQSGLLGPAPRKLWTRTGLGGRGVSYPVIAQGKVYFTAGALLYAVDAATGRDAWGPVDVGKAFSSLAYDAGRIFALGPKNMLWAFDAETGATLWFVDLRSSSPSDGPPAAAYGSVIISGGNHVWSISQLDGTIRWKTFVSNSDGSSPVITPDTVYLNYVGRTWALDFQTGEERWHHSGPCSGAGGATPVLHQGRIYARQGNCEKNQVVDAATGTGLGSFPASDHALIPPPAFSGRVGVFAVPITPYTWKDFTFEAHNVETGGHLWSYAGDGALNGPPVIQNGVVYFPSGSGRISAVSLATGTELWTDHAGAAIVPTKDWPVHPASALGLGDGLLVVPGDGQLTAYGSGILVTGLTVTRDPLGITTEVIIDGTGFLGTTGVQFGAVPAAVFEILSDTRIRVIPPPLPAGVVDIRVIAAGGESPVVAADRYTTIVGTSLPPLLGGPAGSGQRSGYWALGSDGAVYNFGNAPHLGAGDTGAVDLEPAPNGSGYWTLTKNGRIQAFGAAVKLGDVDMTKLVKNETPASLSATPTGTGYWVFTNRGRVIPFGDAAFYGDVASVKLNGPVLGSVAMPTGRGYYMVASDGGIFAFGDAKFAGSMGGTKLNAPVQSLVPDSDGKGYWLVASDGGIFAFDAPFRGSLGGVKLNKPVVGMVRYGDGYLMVGADGGIFNFSSSPFSGSLGDKPPASPIVAVAAL